MIRTTPTSRSSWRRTATAGAALLLGSALGCGSPDAGPTRRVQPTERWTEASAEADGASDVAVAPEAAGFWRARTGGEVWSSPGFPEPGPIVFGSDDRRVYAVDSRDGSERWAVPVEGKVRRAPVPADDRVLVVDESGRIYALAVDDGQTLWRQNLDPDSTVAWAADDTRVVHGGRGPIVCRNATSGGVAWRRRIGGGVRSLSLDADRVYAVTHGGAVVALDARAGEIRWTAELGLDTRSAPTPHGESLLLVGNGFLWSLDARTGDEQWRALTHEFVSASPEVSVDEGGPPIVLVAGGERLFAFDLRRGHELWRRALEGPFRSGPRAFDGRGFVGSGDHLLLGFDLRRGHEEWRFETDAFITAALAVYGHPIHGDRVLFGGVDGALYGVALPESAADADEPRPEPQIRVGPTFFDGSPKIRWRYRSGPSHGPPVGIGDRILSASTDRLACLDVGTGKVLWRKPRVDPWGVPPVVSPERDRVITVDDGRLRAYDLGEGRELWTSPAGRSRARLRVRSLALWGERLFIGTADGKAAAFAVGDGARLWQRSLGAPIPGEPEATDRFVYLGTTAGRLLALDAGNGRELWSAPTAGLAAGPLLDDDVLFVGDTGGTVHAFDPAVGGIRWTAAVGGSLRLGAAGLFGSVFLCGDDGRLFAVDMLTGVETWRRPLGERCTGTPEVFDGIVYAGSQDRSLHAVNAVNGEELWRLHLAAPVVGSEVVADRDGRSLVVVAARDGDLVAVELP